LPLSLALGCLAAKRGLVTLRRGDGARAGFAALVFDLAFVFAITQVSHRLLAHHALTGAVQTGFLFLAVWQVRIFSS